MIEVLCKRGNDVDFLTRLAPLYWIPISFVVLYVVGALVLLITVKTHKDADGHAVLDHNAWYFRAAYPYKYNSYTFITRSKRDGINICPFYARLFFLMMTLWLFLLIVEILKTILYNVFTLPAGVVCKPGIVDFNNNILRPCATTSYGMTTARWYIPTVVYGIYYAILWKFYPRLASDVAVAIVATVVLVGFMALFGWIAEKRKTRKTKVTGEISLFAEWMKAKKSKICINLKVT